MSINKKIEEYKEIIQVGSDDIVEKITEKMCNEEENYSKSKVEKFVQRIEKETGFRLDGVKLWNKVREHDN